MFGRHRDRFVRQLAETLGCDPAAFETNMLTVVERPAASREPFIALVATLGTGTVVSVDARFIEFAQTLTIAPHFRAFHSAAFAQPLVDEAKARGMALTWRGPNLAFVPASAPPEFALPHGFEARKVGREWRAQYLASRLFENGLGEPGNTYVEQFWRSAIVAFGADGEPAALAGTYDDGEGLLEIGVEVARPFRGIGLANAVVARQAAAILTAGATPTYYCAPTNIRSQRTAFACGLVPVASRLVVSVAKGA